MSISGPGMPEQTTLFSLIYLLGKAKPDDSRSNPHKLLDTPGKKRRKREYILAVVFVVLIVSLTWAELKYLSGDYYLILNLLILNVVLLLAMLFYVARNAVRLILERRRKVLGSKLRTRLVLAFISLSLIPTVLIYLVSVKFVQTSVDYWFKGQVEESMEQALELGRAFMVQLRIALSDEDRS